MKKMFRKKPVVTADNYFIDDVSLEYVDGVLQLGALGTAARKKLPKDIKECYLHKQKTILGDKHAKCVQYANPVVAVKDDPNGKFQRVHMSFQSTSSCSITSANALPLRTV